MTKEVKITPTRMSAKGYAQAFLGTKSAKARAEIISACEAHVANGASRKIANTLSAMKDGNTASLKCRVSGDWSSYKRTAKQSKPTTTPKAKAPANDPMKALASELAGNEELFAAFFNMVAEARK
tara:strand:+ start:1405 stop:1779 length:375 start_codon:yes stop_codon:yes gene_type:complete